jgi:hypothetical protein
MTPVSRDVVELTLRLCEGLGNARALTVATLVRYEQWDTLATLACDPGHYLSAKDYAKSAAATHFLRKCSDLPTTFDRHKAALDNWWQGERDCYRANERLERYLPQHSNADDSDPRIRDFFSRVRKTMLRWLGPSPRALTSGRFGPGATFSDKGKLSTIPDKMTSHPSMTRDAIWYLPQWLSTQWGSACAAKSRSPVVVRGNRFGTAPKDATKDRAVAPEPSINSFYQLGLGSEIRANLSQIGNWMSPGKGIDLNNGQDVHKRVACAASIRGHLATEDLSNASDSVCTTLVRICTPHAWFEALSALRSPFTLVDGHWVKLEKFSSMGNGFTFELETIIFLALCHEALIGAGITPVIGENLYVYGDDIIVPTDGVRAVNSVLNFCGFRLNLKKSFSEGPFRESCGGDYFDGEAVRPFFLKEQPTEPQHWMVIANGLRALSTNLANPEGFAMVRRAWFFCLDQLPSKIRGCRGPEALGDLVIHDSEDRWQFRWRSSGIRYLRCYRVNKRAKVSYGNFHPDVVLACATYGLGWGDGGVTPRDSVLSYKVGWVPFS